MNYDYKAWKAQEEGPHGEGKGVGQSRGGVVLRSFDGAVQAAVGPVRWGLGLSGNGRR